MMGVAFDASLVSGTLSLGSDPLAVTRSAAGLDAPDQITPTVSAVFQSNTRIANASFGSDFSTGPDIFTQTVVPKEAPLDTTLALLEPNRETFQVWSDLGEAGVDAKFG
jgi:hypothetical protein